MPDGRDAVKVENVKSSSGKSGGPPWTWRTGLGLGGHICPWHTQKDH